MAGAAYKSQFFAFMFFLDGTTYSPSDHIAFSQERLLEITDLNVANFLTFKAYGPNLFPEEGPDEFPITITRSSTLAFYKKAILSYMPCQRQQWDKITGQGSPTKSAAAQQVIKDLKKREVRGSAVLLQARRAIDWDEFMCLLVGTCLGFPLDDVQYIMLAVLMLQWQIIGRIDDVMQLATTTIQSNSMYPFTLQVKMCWSKNIVKENESPTQFLFASMNPLVCPLFESCCVF